MPKGRSGLFFVIIVIALLIILVLLLRQRGLLGSPAAKEAQIPIELRKIIPAGWEPLAGQPQACDLDGDGETEWLVLYRYDATAVPDIYGDRKNLVPFKLIGGVVFDAQANRLPQELGNLSPYRPALLVPYKLLPDFYADKGQGYLGENNVRFYLYSSAEQERSRTARACRAEEFYFLGYSYLPLPTRLSIFRWAGPQVGYRGVHFVGNAHVDAEGVTDGSKPVTRVTTYNRLENHRSVLCEVKVFDRTEPGALNFEPNPDKFTIDFCFGTPSDPVYPEAVLIAMLRGGSPPAAQSPTRDSFLTRNAAISPRLAERLDTVKGNPIQIMSVTNQGTVLVHPQNGYRCASAMLQSTEGETWWCGAEEAYVQAAIVLNGETKRITAHLISIANEKVTASVHWRIINLTLD